MFTGTKRTTVKVSLNIYLTFFGYTGIIKRQICPRESQNFSHRYTDTRWLFLDTLIGRVVTSLQPSLSFRLSNAVRDQSCLCMCSSLQSLPRYKARRAMRRASFRWSSHPKLHISSISICLGRAGFLRVRFFGYITSVIAS
jgi:hypothetical protein